MTTDKLFDVKLLVMQELAPLDRSIPKNVPTACSGLALRAWVHRVNLSSAQLKRLAGHFARGEPERQCT